MLSIFNLAIGSAVTGAVLIAAVLLLVLYKCWRNFRYFPVIPPEDNVYTERYAIIQTVLSWLVFTKLTGFDLYSPSLGGTPVYRPNSPPGPVYPLPDSEVVDTTIFTEPSSTTSFTDSGIHTTTITQTSRGKQWHTCIYGYRHGLCCCILTEQHYLHMSEYVSSLTTAWYFWCIHNIG